MKKLYIFGAIAAALTFSSCDNIGEGERLIEVERNHSEKVVLLEDFTGQRCVNCPDVAAIIDNLHASYGENFIAVGLHAKTSPFTEPLSKDLDLRCEEADVYFKEFGVQDLPSAMIDRVTFDGKKVITAKELISARVYKQLQQTTPVDISLQSEYNNATREVSIDSKVKFTDPINEEVAIQLWVIENNIVGPQLTSSSINRKYVHNHIMRAAINGTWGESLGASFMPGDEMSKTNKIKLNEKWEAENCQVVGFIYRKSDKVILQAHLVDVHKIETNE